MHLKEFQESVLERLGYYLDVLKEECIEEQTYQEFQQTKGKTYHLKDYPQKAWSRLAESQKLPTFKDKHGNAKVLPYLDKKDGMGDPIPNICLKVPTGGGKTLLGVSAVERINTDYFSKQIGLVLWVVPTDAIYRQTIKNFKDRSHPYRKVLERASAGRVKILEKTNPFSIQNLRDYLCVMVIMLQSTNRETKESLRVFKDSGRFIDFFPQPDDYHANTQLLADFPNLDSYEENITLGGSKRISVKHSLGNAIRVAKPIVVLDEGHRAYSELARDTICNLNPRFILELSATPNMRMHLSNVLVSVSGVKLKEEEMIKLPINVTNSDKADWKKTLCLACEEIKSLEEDSKKHYKNSKSYIRPIMLIQVESTGKDQKDKNKIHAEDVREYLTKQLGVHESAVKVKTAEKNELKDESLLSDTSQVQFIITKYALQEGWDCPFAYVLVILSNTQSKKALTQLIGRILRQPYAQVTPIEALNESHVFCYDKKVTEVVEGIKKGLQEEGMGDLVDHIRISENDNNVQEVSIKRRRPFRNTKIFLPRVLHKDKAGWRSLVYGEDILKDIDFSQISYRKKDTFTAENFDSLQVDHIKLDIENKMGQFDLPYITREKEKASIEMDYSYMVKRLSNFMPNPWEASRVLGETMNALQEKRISDEKVYLNRNHLLHSIEVDIQEQIEDASEKLFMDKLSKGDICFKIFKDTIDLNWVMPKEIDFLINVESEKVLRQRDDSDLQLSLFEKTYEKHYNDYEQKVAWYLDEREAIRWWHRMVARQDYYLQGWQKQKVWPDFLACVDTENGEVGKLSVLETKGDHLKGNDDTEYKRKLFDLLEKYAHIPIDVGEVETASATEERMVFKILMEKHWETEITEVA